MTRSEESIVRVHERWLAAEIAEDLETLGSLLHEDALILMPGGARISGRMRCIEFMATVRPRIASIGISNLWIRGDAQFGLKVADFQTRFIDRHIPPATGTHTWCLKREGDEWRILMMTWTLKADPGSGCKA